MKRPPSVGLRLAGGRLRHALRLAGMVGVTGLPAGALGGWIGLARGDGSVEVASAAAPLFWILMVLAPAGLALGLSEQRDESGRPSPTLVTPAGAAGIGAAGGLLAALLFLVTSSQVPAVMGGEDAAELIVLLRERIFWRDAAILSALTGLAGLALVFLRK